MTSYLAPMLGITDNPGFLYLCMKHGCDVLVFPMIFAEGMAANPDMVKTKLALLDEHSCSFDFRPIIIQVITGSVDRVKNAVDVLSSYDIQGINLNLGCPSAKARRLGVGASMLNRDKERDEIINAYLRHSPVPFSIKMRLMGSARPDMQRTITFCKGLEGSVAWLAIHGRTLQQGYGGLADWVAIKAIHDAVDVMVIGNGDISCKSEGIQKINAGFCNGYMIGRAALKDPRVFDAEYMPGPGSKSMGDARSLVRQMVSFLSRCGGQVRDESLNLHEIRQFSIQYTKGVPGAKALRDAISKAQDIHEIEDLFNMDWM